jgi:hypothetical protein
VVFGLGDGTDTGEVLVRWPDGRSEIFQGVRANAYTTLRQGGGTPAP